MSIKTLRKRIALVAVSALGVGLLSVAPAKAGDIAANQLVVAAIGSGNTYLSMCANTTASNVDSAVIPATSVGLQLETTSGAAGDNAYVVVTGPGIIGALGANWTADSTTSAAASTLTGTADAADDVTIKPTGVGTIKVSYSASSTSAVLDAITITVVSACAGDAYSAAKSYVTTVNSTEAADGSWTETLVDTSGANRVVDDGKGYVKVRLNDAYGANLATSGALIATATGANCRVGVVAYDGTLAAGKSASAVLSSAANDDVVIVQQVTAGTPASCSVAITFNGTNVGTKSFTFEGAPAKITVSDVTAGIVGTANSGLYRVSVTDSAGNSLSGQVISASSSEANNAAALASGVITNVQDTSGAATASASDASDGKTKAVAYADRADSNMTGYTCGAEGTAKLTVRTNVDSASTSYITSDPFTVVCGGALDTWTISMDKASYAPGEIATLTLSGKTAKGNPVGTFVFLSGVEYSFGGMTAVTAPTNNDAFSSGLGIKTYKFSVGTTEGSFVGTFKTTGTTDDAAKTVQYKVAATTASVTNAEVLAAIVKLIASINKQIRALQKQLRR